MRKAASTIAARNAIHVGSPSSVNAMRGSLTVCPTTHAERTAERKSVLASSAVASGRLNWVAKISKSASSLTPRRTGEWRGTFRVKCSTSAWFHSRYVGIVASSCDSDSDLLRAAGTDPADIVAMTRGDIVQGLPEGAGGL